MSAIGDANDILLALFMEGGEEIDVSDLAVTFGNVEMLLDDETQTAEVSLAAVCARLGHMLLLGTKYFDYEDVRETFAAMQRGISAYWDAQFK